MLLQIRHTLTIDLHHLEWARLLHEILGHDTHAWSHLKYRKIGKRLVYSISYSLGDTQVSQEVLAEILLRSYLLHLGDKGSEKGAKYQIKTLKKAGRIHIQPALVYAFSLKTIYLSPKFMSLLALTVSATQTAMTNVTIKPKTITFSFLYSLKRYPVCLKTMQRYDCLRTQARF